MCYRYAIADYSDRFYVEQQKNKGFVKIQKGLDGQTLDRETSSKYTVEVLAIDKGQLGSHGQTKVSQGHRIRLRSVRITGSD